MPTNAQTFRACGLLSLDLTEPYLKTMGLGLVPPVAIVAASRDCVREYLPRELASTPEPPPGGEPGDIESRLLGTVRELSGNGSERNLRQWLGDVLPEESLWRRLEQAWEAAAADQSLPAILVDEWRRVRVHAQERSPGDQATNQALTPWDASLADHWAAALAALDVEDSDDDVAEIERTVLCRQWREMIVDGFLTEISLAVHNRYFQRYWESNRDRIPSAVLDALAASLGVAARELMALENRLP